MSIDHGKLPALADAPPIPAWLIDADQSRVWAAAWETLYRAITLAQPAEAVECNRNCDCVGECKAGIEGVGKPAEAVEGADDYVAFLRFDDHNGTRPTSVHLCDSDHPDAFKVYREPKRITPTDAAQGAVASVPMREVAEHNGRLHDLDYAIACLKQEGYEYTAAARVQRVRAWLATRPQAAPAQGDGWKLVPVNATEEMRSAFAIAMGDTRILGAKEQFRIAYAKLLAAAPSQEPGS